jgi:hypothetical protein
LECLDRGLDRPDFITGRTGHRPHRTRSITQRGDGGLDVLRHVLILLEHTFVNQWKTLWIQEISGSGIS